LKRLLAAIATLGLLGAVLWFSRAPTPSQPAAANTPERCLDRMFRAAEQGDIDGYLDCFTGEERPRLERNLASQTREAFSRSLVQAVQELKARAVIGGAEDANESGQAELSVERVYAHRNELQTFRLLKQGDTWRISSVQTATPFEPPVPFGTPAFAPPTEAEK
jgi:hypothetical protein